MSELRTLVNIETQCVDVCPKKCEGIQKLRDVAIEWIKAMQVAEDEMQAFPLDEKYKVHNSELWATKAVLKKLFNIIDGELK